MPEERLGHAAAPDMPLSDNVLLTTHGDGTVVTAGVVRHSVLNTLFGGIVKGFDVRFGGRDPKARRLSGGNLQKFVIGREVLRGPVLLDRRPADLGRRRRRRRLHPHHAARPRRRRAAPCWW